MKQSKVHILYIDDEEINLRLFRLTFNREFKLYTATSGKEGLKTLENHNIDVVITDQRMPVMTGVELLKRIKEQFPHIPPARLIISGFSQSKEIEKAYSKYSLYKFISKPWEEVSLRQIIYESLKKENYA